MYKNLFKPRIAEVLDALLQGEKTLDELSALLGSSKSNIKQQYLNDLERMDIVEKTIIRTKVGRQARFRLKPFTIVMSIEPVFGNFLLIESKAPIDPDRVLLHQVDGPFMNDIRRLLDNIDPLLIRETLVILFGSVAVGKGTGKSDIDLLFLRDDWQESEESILNSISDISLDIDHRISPVFMRKSDFIDKKAVIIEEIKRDGIILNGRMVEDGVIWHQMKRYSSITF